MRSLVASRAAAAVTATLLLAACGGSPTGSSNASGGAAPAENAEAMKTYQRINGLTGQERTDELVTCAEKEGALSIYTSNTDIDDVVAGFEDQYDIETSVYRGNSESVLQRILQEQKADFYGNDVIETNALELNVTNQEGYLADYQSELRDAVREEGQAEGWTATRFNTFVVGWNTDLVKPGEEPKTIEELAEPQWAGKISLEVGDVDWFTALYQYFVNEKGMSEEEATDLFTRIAANAKIVKGHTVQGELLSAGQFAVTLSSYSHTIDKAAADGAPVAWRPATGAPVQPVVVRPNGIGLMKTAGNPCAALLFVDWELTGGQQIFKDKFRIGATAEAAEAIADLEVIAVPEQELLDNPQKWDDMYEEITSGGSN
jgi:iron(III) transport system substrate-binding protein